MRLLSTFYSRGEDLARGWWVRVEGTKGQRRLRLLWKDAAGPDFDDLAAVIAELGAAYGLDEALRRAREDPLLVRRTKPVAHEVADREPS
jgi:hypothetical protein